MLLDSAEQNLSKLDGQSKGSSYRMKGSETEIPGTTILVTGASGFIGKRLVKKLLTVARYHWQLQHKMYDERYRLTFKPFSRRQ